MTGIARRLTKLEGVVRRAPAAGLDALNDAEIDLAWELVCRAALENASAEDERAKAEADLADIEKTRATLRSNLGPHDGGVEWVNPSCGCDALPYRHEPHRTVDEIAAHLAAWAGNDERATA